MDVHPHDSKLPNLFDMDFECTYSYSKEHADFDYHAIIIDANDERATEQHAQLWPCHPYDVNIAAHWHHYSLHDKTTLC